MGEQKALIERLPGHVFSRIHHALGFACGCVRPDGSIDTEALGKEGSELCHFIADEMNKVRSQAREEALKEHERDEYKQRR